MRWYSIVLTNPTTGQLITPKSMAGLNSQSSYSSSSTGQVSGTPLLGGLNLNLDIPVSPYALPHGNAWVELEGVSLQEISQANNLSGANISVYAGFQKGLPLENPGQAGLLVKGTVYQAFGNWIGTEQTLDFLIYPPTGTNDNPINLSFQWTKGQTLSAAIQQTLSTAFPSPAYSIVVNITSNIVAPQDQVGYYSTLGQFATYIYRMSKLFMGANYQGVSIILQGNRITVDDGTVQAAPKKINFQDLIGQPTWIQYPALQFKCPMRSDIQVADYVTLPEALVTTGVGTTNPLVNANLTFKGTFQITNVRHVGNFREPTADSWVTVFDAVQPPAGR